MWLSKIVAVALDFTYYYSLRDKTADSVSRTLYCTAVGYMIKDKMLSKYLFSNKISGSAIWDVKEWISSFWIPYFVCRIFLLIKSQSKIMNNVGYIKASINRHLKTFFFVSYANHFEFGNPTQSFSNPLLLNSYLCVTYGILSAVSRVNHRPLTTSSNSMNMRWQYVWSAGHYRMSFLLAKQNVIILHTNSIKFICQFV